MKKLIISAVLLIITLTSCSSDESAKETIISKTDIIGNWKSVSAEQNGKNYELTSCDKSGLLQFNEDGHCMIETGSMTNNQCVLSKQYGSYTLEGNILTYSFYKYESKSKITEVTANSFKSTTFYFKDEVGVENIPENEQITYKVSH